MQGWSCLVESLLHPFSPPVHAAANSSPSSPHGSNPFNTILTFFFISSWFLLPIISINILKVPSLSPSPPDPESYLVHGALSPQIPVLVVVRWGQICECSPPACFLLALFGSDANINHTAGTDKVNRERERERGEIRRRRRGGWSVCSLIQRSDFPSSTCLSIYAFVYEPKCERVCCSLFILQCSDVAAVGGCFNPSDYVWGRVWRGGLQYTLLMLIPASLFSSTHPSFYPSWTIPPPFLQRGYDWISRNDVSKFPKALSLLPSALGEGREQYCKNKRTMQKSGESGKKKESKSRINGTEMKLKAPHAHCLTV